MSICIFADISRRVGHGHFWRSMRLAQQLAQRGHAVTCVVPDNKGARNAITHFHQIANAFPAVTTSRLRLPDSLTADPFEALPPAYVRNLPLTHDCYIIDNYRISKQHLHFLRDLRKKVIVIDDYDHRLLTAEDAALIINPSLPRTVLPYGDAVVLSPPNEHLIPPAFFRSPNPLSSTVFIGFGGTDRGQLGLRLLHFIIEQHPDLADSGLDFKTLVVGGNPTRDSEWLLKKLGPQRFTPLPKYDAASLFGEVAMLICGGGQTVLEAQAGHIAIAGVGILNKSHVLLGNHLKSQGIVLQNLQKEDDHKILAKLRLFAEKLGPIIRNNSGIVLTPQNPRGLENLIEKIASFDTARL